VSRDGELLRILDASWTRAVALAGDHLACRPGCTACCIGPFPITALDAERLCDGIRRLDPATRNAVIERAREDVAAMGPTFPGDPAEGWLEGDDEAIEAFLLLHGERPCPALDPASGRCLVYEHRPVSCRTFGPPTRIGSEDLPPCGLCFSAADAGEVERCRVEPDPDGVEESLLEDGRETLVAFVLSRS
jgi:Fe-S-cluster containining protein